MRTTLIIPDQIVQELKRRAARQGQPLSMVVAETLRRGLDRDERPGPLPPLPTYRMGRPRVDLADRNALYRIIDDG